MRNRTLLAVAVIALTCGGPGQKAPLTVQAEGGGPLLITAIGGTLQLVSAPGAAWSSSKPSVATVSDAGLVTAVANGITAVTAAAGGQSATVNLTVAQAADTIAVLPASAQIERGAAVTFSFSALDAKGNPDAVASVVWSIGNPAIASISQDGVATGLAPGATTVSAAADGKTGSANLSVAVPAAAAVAVSAAASGPLASIDETRQLAALATDSRGNPIPEAIFVWTSSDAAILSVDASGLVTAKANGTATVTAASGAAHGSLSLTVAQAVHSVSVAPASVTLPPGGTQDFTAAALDARSHPLAAPPAAVWNSGNVDVATIDANGHAHANALLTALSSVDIRATVAGVTSPAATLTVDPAQAPVAAIVVSGGGVTLASLGDSVQLSAQAISPSGTVVPGVAIAWSSSDATIAHVDASGLVTAVANGVATISASGGGKTGQANVTVQQAVAAVTVSGPASLTLTSLGATLQLSAAASDARGGPVAGATFLWTTSDATVATVSGTGLVTAQKNGTARITAASGSKSAFADVTVAQKVASVSVTPAQATLPPNSVQDFTAASADANGHPVAGTAAWSSSSAVVTIDATGHATIGPVSAVTQVTITAVIAGVSGLSALTIDPAAAPVDHVTVTNGGATLTALGDTRQLSAQAFDSSGTALNRTISWSSGDASIASVDSTGLVKAVGNGVATITASSGGKNGTAQMTIQQAVNSVQVATHVAGASATLASFNQTLQLDAAAFDHNLHPIAGATFTWSSDAPAVVSVDATGLAKAVSNGSAHVTATSSLVMSAGFAVTVAQAVASVQIAGASTALTSIGDTLQLSATAKDALGSAVAGTTFTWRVSGAAASVDQNGLVTAAANGSASAFAKAPNNVESTGFAVTVAQVVKSVVVKTLSGAASATMASLQITLQLAATALDNNGHAVPGAAFSWASDSASATVDTNGLVKSFSNGSANITAADGTVKSANFPVTIQQVVAGVAVMGSATITSINATTQLSAAASDGNQQPMSGVTFTWSPSSSTVATVDSTGLVTAKGNGMQNITATAPNSVAGSLTVTVAQAVATVTVSATASISRGATHQFTAVAKDANGFAVASAPAATWQSSNTGVAAVDTSGLATGGCAGTATITGTTSGKSGTAQLTSTGGSAVTFTVSNWFAGVGDAGTLNICAGDSVQWGVCGHTATSCNSASPPTGCSSFTSATGPAFDTGTTCSGPVTVQFNTAITAPGLLYCCIPHQCNSMRGHIIVQ